MESTHKEGEVIAKYFVLNLIILFIENKYSLLSSPTCTWNVHFYHFDSMTGGDRILCI